LETQTEDSPKEEDMTRHGEASRKDKDELELEHED